MSVWRDLSTSALLALMSAAPGHALAEEFTPIVASLSNDASCPVEITMVNPDDFYPPGSIRRQESGEVVIEFTAEGGSSRVSDITLFKSSEFADLDNAALKLGRRLKVSASCGPQRLSLSVVFDVWTDPLDQPRSGGCLTMSGARVATVLIFPAASP